MPASLRDRVLASVSGEPCVGEAQVAATLRTVGERLLCQAMNAPAGRDTAITLLTADALMTFACEAMAETDPEKL